VFVQVFVVGVNLLCLVVCLMLERLSMCLCVCKRLCVDVIVLHVVFVVCVCVGSYIHVCVFMFAGSIVGLCCCLCM